MSCFLLYFRGFNLRFVRLITTSPRPPEASHDKQKIIILNKRYKRELWSEEGESMATLSLMINFRFNACLFDMSWSSRLGQRGWPRYCNCFSDVIRLLFRPLNLMVPVFKMIFFLIFSVNDISTYAVWSERLQFKSIYHATICIACLLCLFLNSSNHCQIINWKYRKLKVTGSRTLVFV